MLSNNISNHQKKYLIKSSKTGKPIIIGFPFLLNHRKSNTNNPIFYYDIKNHILCILQTTIQKTAPKPKILQQRMQRRSTQTQKQNILQPMVQQKPHILLHQEKRHRPHRST